MTVKMKPNRKRARAVIIRLDDEEYNAFVAAAERIGLGIGTWLRIVGRSAAGMLSQP